MNLKKLQQSNKMGVEHDNEKTEKNWKKKLGKKLGKKLKKLPPGVLLLHRETSLGRARGAGC